MFCQCLAGVVGLRIAIEALLAFFGEKTPVKTPWLATALALALIFPLTPVAVYFMTFLEGLLDRDPPFCGLPASPSAFSGGARKCLSDNS